MNTPLPLFHRLVVMLEKFNKQPRAMSMRGAVTERRVAAVKPRGPAAALLVAGGGAEAHAMAPVRKLSTKSARSWRQGAAQTPSNLM